MKKLVQLGRNSDFPNDVTVARPVGKWEKQRVFPQWNVGDVVFRILVGNFIGAELSVGTTELRGRMNNQLEGFNNEPQQGHDKSRNIENEFGFRGLWLAPTRRSARATSAQPMS